MPLDAYACLVFQAAADPSTDFQTLGWRPGPLPVPIPARAGQKETGVADRAERTRYFAPRIQGVLYGDGEAQQTYNSRWHMVIIDETEDDHGSRLECWELLRYEADGLLLLVAHIQLGADPITSIGSLSATSGKGREWLERIVPKPILLDNVRPRSVSHLIWDDEVIPEPELSSAAAQAVSRWSTLQRWQWFLASGVPPETMLPDADAPDLSNGTVWLSYDWRALVLRDGIAYVATTTCKPTAGLAHNNFHMTARAYVRALHLDALLLGIVQLTTLQRHADATSEIGDGGQIDAARIAELEARLLKIRARVWWQDIAQRGEQVGSVLRAFQNQHRVTAIYRKIVEDLTDASRYTLARQAALADEARDLELQLRERKEADQRLKDERQRAFERSLTVISFIFLPTSLIFAAMALWSDPSRSLWLVSVVSSLAFVVLVLVVSPELRNALRKR